MTRVTASTLVTKKDKGTGDGTGVAIHRVRTENGGKCPSYGYGGARAGWGGAAAGTCTVSGASRYRDRRESPEPKLRQNKSDIVLRRDEQGWH